MWLWRISGWVNPGESETSPSIGRYVAVRVCGRPSAGTGTTRGFRWLIDARSTLELGAYTSDPPPAARELGGEQPGLLLRSARIRRPDSPW